jgi:hypothetical protein
MIAWLRALRYREQHRLGKLLKDRVAAVLGVTVKSRSDVHKMIVAAPRQPLLVSASPRHRPASAHVKIPIENFEDFRAAVEASKKVDMTVAMMTTSRTKKYSLR